MASKDQVVKALCDNLQLPAIGVQAERTVVELGIATIYDHVPQFVWDIVVSAADGISREDIDHVMTFIESALSRYAKIPYMPEMLRRELIKHVLTTIRESLQVDRYLEIVSR